MINKAISNRPNLILIGVVATIVIIWLLTLRPSSKGDSEYDVSGRHRHRHHGHSIKRAMHKSNMAARELITHKALIHELQGGHHDEMTTEPMESSTEMTTTAATYSIISTTPINPPTTTEL
ncbi:hypothetical protein LSH36_771g00013 [Paralvinella palmiformis]|uniref:Uncharacterized protein n=1 Tax=Paralvinella palmiformis TaxID=53620 RepID=A0AAD9MUG7_9ANNE|nr:hypothetical protein LSH36_771g00013 [Paralvinella palmiformis]